MDIREGRRVLGYFGDASDKTIINQIMLRFRPIAPKPAVSGADSDLAALNTQDIMISKRRSKRKYVRVRRNNNNNNRLRKSQTYQQIGEDKEIRGLVTQTAVTLQLLPDDNNNPMKKSHERERSGCNQAGNLKLKEVESVDCVDQTTVKKIRVESWVTVECVTKTYACMDSGIGLTDVERVKNLEEEVRPGFISDGSDKVRWVNGAYKRMLMKKEEENNIIVCLVSQQKLVPFEYCSAFRCWVRLEEKETEKSAASKMVPCDVWRMDCGGFAWRLDIEAALSLSLSLSLGH
ncbi:hypothetical protein M5689_009243 [Euphorbia peplus]|nr:hypothetical protein M5689_009243 [Euphorbia peplus]